MTVRVGPPDPELCENAQQDVLERLSGIKAVKKL
jgi:hypothetical protein